MAVDPFIQNSSITFSQLVEIHQYISGLDNQEFLHNTQLPVFITFRQPFWSGLPSVYVSSHNKVNSLLQWPNNKSSSCGNPAT